MSPVVPSMADRDGKIWMDGQMVDWRDAKIHVLTHTLHYGCGAFEGVRAYNTVNGTAVFRLQEHTERLFNSAKILRMKIPFTQDEVNAAQCAVVRENKLESGYLRPRTQGAACTLASLLLAACSMVPPTSIVQQPLTARPQPQAARLTTLRYCSRSTSTGISIASNPVAAWSVKLSAMWS